MTDEQIARAVRLRLAAELEADRASLARLATSIGKLAADARPGTEDIRAMAIAFQLERFYTAVEAILSRVLRTIDGDVPSGPDWHTEILRASTVAIERLRPAVVPREALPLLRDLLGFRHFARHGYDRTPDLVRVEELASVALRAAAIIDTALADFELVLRTEGRAEGKGR